MIQESLGRSYSVPDDIDEEELMGELDALEADMGMETEGIYFLALLLSAWKPKSYYARQKPAVLTGSDEISAFQ
ncbi:hypothetical protein C3L33_16842, partial [Rhododendron williamsianum]